MSYPEIRPRIAAVVSAAGGVGGPPLANDVEQALLALFRNWPGHSACPVTGARSRVCALLEALLRLIEEDLADHAR